MNDLKRVFIAINIPSQIKKELFEEFSKKLSKKLKIVKEENFHITLRFLGYLNDEALKELRKKLSQLNEKQFEIEIQGVGEFNSRVLWIGIKKGNQELENLSKKINNILNLSPEKFHSHITIARNKELKKKEVLELIKKIQSNKKWVFKAKKISVMQSILLNKGPKYLELFFIPLRQVL
jgi:2'-5' RNA ligase